MDEEDGIVENGRHKIWNGTKSKYSLRLVKLFLLLLLLSLMVSMVEMGGGGCVLAAAAASENQKRAYTLCVRKKYNSRTILRSEEKIEAFY